MKNLLKMHQWLPQVLEFFKILGIMAWALAINEYHAKSKIVKPK
jgi:hypothetical protein